MFTIFWLKNAKKSQFGRFSGGIKIGSIWAHGAPSRPSVPFAVHAFHMLLCSWVWLDLVLGVPSGRAGVGNDRDGLGFA